MRWPVGVRSLPHRTEPRLSSERDVRSLFELIAPRYDRFTRWFSFGMDASWKRELVRYVVERVPRGGRIVDVACGTGDLGFAAARGVSGSHVLGVDVAGRMLALAAKRREATCLPVTFARGDMLALPAADASIDAVLAGYGVRNTAGADLAVAQVSRVLRSGGWFFILDFYQPRHPLWRRVFLAYLAAMGSLYGWVWHGEPSVYRYIAGSIRRHMTAGAFTRLLESSGFRVELQCSKLGGGIALHVARKK